MNWEIIRSRLLFATLLLIAVATISGRSVQAADTLGGTDGLKSDAGAPANPLAADNRTLSWVHEGLLLNYTWTTMICPGTSSSFEENDKCEWIDPVTGAPLIRSERRGTGGAGWAQVVVTCLEGNQVALSQVGFADARPNLNAAPVPLAGLTATIAPVNEPGEYWMDPAKLAALHSLPESHGQGMVITPVTWKLDNRTIEALRVVFIHGGSYVNHVYAKNTGLCLHYGTVSRGTPPKLIGPGDIAQGDTYTTHGDFIGARDLKFPWASQGPPQWLSTLHALHYHGKTLFRGGALVQVPNSIDIDMTLTDHGRGWAQLADTISVQYQNAPPLPPTRAALVYGRAQCHSLWIDPAVLDKLQEGQVLDEDPLTKMKTAVTHVRADSIAIESISGGGEIGSEYDRRTGILSGSSFYSGLSRQQILVKLRSQQ